MRILLFGDENFSFCNGFLVDHEDDIVEICSCLKENELKQENKNNIQSLSKNVVIHYGINPVQLKSKFPPNTFDALYYILPGLSFHGYPDFIDPQTEMFKLRLNLFCFSFLKSSKNIIKPGGYIYLLFPSEIENDCVVNDTDISSTTISNKTNLPFLTIEPNKLAKFCNVIRDNHNDYYLNLSNHPNWLPVLFNMPIVNEIPDFLKNCKYFCFKMTDAYYKNKALKPNAVNNENNAAIRNSSNNNKDENNNNDNNNVQNGEQPDENNANNIENEENKEKEDPDEYNVLKIPPQVFDYPIEKLGHVNECFLFKLYSINSKSILISRLTLKYDPRISGWKGDNKIKKDLMNIPMNNLNIPINMPMNINNMNTINNLNMMKNMNNLMNINKFKGGKYKNKLTKNDFQQQYKNNIMQNNMSYTLNKKGNMNLPPPPPANMGIQPNNVNNPNHNINYKQNNFPFVNTFKPLPNNLSQNVQNTMANMPMNVNHNISGNMINPYINGGYPNNFRNNMYQQSIPIPPPINNFNKKIYQGRNMNIKRKSDLYNYDSMDKGYDNYNMKDNYKSDDDSSAKANACNDDYDLDQCEYNSINHKGIQNQNSEDPDYYFLKQRTRESSKYGTY